MQVAGQNLLCNLQPALYTLRVNKAFGGRICRFKKFRKVLHRLLSNILKREDDYIETPLIVEKVRLIV